MAGDGMRRLIALALISACLPLVAQQPDSLQALTGKEVLVKIDMPGTQKGVDLRFNKTPPMDWKDYGKRLKQYGVAVRKGDTARITAIVQKNDHVEVQLNGGGFGTFGDNTDTSVLAKVADKSDYEKQLERDISSTSDPDRRRSLQRDLDRERSRRERQDNANRRDAQIASLGRQQQVASDRAAGGSRFNLRWAGSVPPEMQTPDALLHLLADYLVLDQGTTAPSSALAPGQENASGEAGSPAAQLKRGMTMAEVAALLGPNRQISESSSPDGLQTDVEEYSSGDHRVQVTFVDGIVVRYTINSR